MVDLFVNSGDPDQTPRSAASDLGLHCLPVTRLVVSNLWVKALYFPTVHSHHRVLNCSCTPDMEILDLTLG